MAGALTAAIASIFSGSAVTTDPYFEYTTLLLPGSGTNGAQNNTFLDGSTNNFTITRNGNTTQGTFSPFSQTGWGNYFDGTGDWLSIPANSAFDFGTGDFTVECWFYYNTTPPASYDYLWAIGGNNTNGIALYINNGQPRIWNGSLILSTTGSISGFTWYHLAAVRSSGTLTVYLNGTSIGSVSLTSNLTGGASAGPKIARWDGVDLEEFTGYISNFRIVKGVAVYTGAFTPPTSPLAATQSAGTNISAITGTQTSLLTCQSNRFIDNSTNNFTITRNGDTRVVAFSPFNPAASWSAATYGGSGYFDGNGDYLTAPSNAAFAVGSVFTIEFWLYPISAGANPVYIYLNENSGSLQFGLNSGTLSLAAAGVAWRLIGSKGPVTNAWNHCVLVRSGTGTSQTSIFLNGERIANGTVTDAWTTDVQAIIQSTLGTSYLTTGYMSGIRIVKGTAVYDPTLTSLTVPTAPLTAITNTSLLLNFTNAGVYDATSKNDLETVGDAQISNAVTPKWGSTSIKFDGTGDYLTNSVINSPLYQFGSGDFTVEMWIYPTTVSVVQYLIDFRDPASTTSAGIQWFINTSAKTGCYVGTTGIITASTTSISANTWTHVALVKNGTGSGNYKIYINGAADATTGTNTTSLTQGFLSIGTSGGQRNTASTDKFNGYIQDLRITLGVARYTTNFTPGPAAAFPTL
jgi:hypothetical protein